MKLHSAVDSIRMVVASVPHRYRPGAINEATRRCNLTVESSLSLTHPKAGVIEYPTLS